MSSKTFGVLLFGFLVCSASYAKESANSTLLRCLQGLRTQYNETNLSVSPNKKYVIVPELSDRGQPLRAAIVGERNIYWLKAAPTSTSKTSYTKSSPDGEESKVEGNSALLAFGPEGEKSADMSYIVYHSEKAEGENFASVWFYNGFDDKEIKSIPQKGLTFQPYGGMPTVTLRSQPADQSFAELMTDETKSFVSKNVLYYASRAPEILKFQIEQDRDGEYRKQLKKKGLRKFIEPIRDCSKAMSDSALSKKLDATADQIVEYARKNGLIEASALPASADGSTSSTVGEGR